MPAEGKAMTDLDEVPSDTLFKVETHGIDAIPDADRHGRPRELGFLWAGAFVNYASLLTASLLTTYYGLGVWDGLLAVLIGTLAGAVILVVAGDGHRTVKCFETFGAVAFAACALRLSALLAGQMRWTAGATAAGADYPGASVLGAMSCFALVASWYPFASDYSRYLPA